MKQVGTCLCGKVSITVEKMNHEVAACHCSMCRKWTAGPFLSVSAGTSKTITILPENQVTRYSSSAWAERGFCKTCGTSLFYHGLSDDSYYVAVDLFEDNEHFELQEEIFYDRKPAYYAFSNTTQKVTEAEILASFSE